MRREGDYGGRPCLPRVPLTSVNIISVNLARLGIWVYAHPNLDAKSSADEQDVLDELPSVMEHGRLLPKARTGRRDSVHEL